MDLEESSQAGAALPLSQAIDSQVLGGRQGVSALSLFSNCDAKSSSPFSIGGSKPKALSLYISGAGRRETAGEGGMLRKCARSTLGPC